MSIALESKPAPDLAVWPAGEQRLLLDGVGWSAYQLIGEALRDRPGLRITFDQGKLEIMTTSQRHEMLKKRAGRLVEVVAEEMNLTAETGGNMTFKKEDRERGLESDDCFWIANEPLIRGKNQWDPEVDPPPDLAVEIELSPSPLNRMAIYASLGVPEVWRYRDETLGVFLLQPDQTYRPSESSLSFPGVSIAELGQFLQPDLTMDYLAKLREARAWVRKQLTRPKSKE